MQIPNSVQTFLDNLKIKTKPQVSNPRLQSAIDELFRSNATIIGGTAGAIIYERTLRDPSATGKSSRRQISRGKRGTETDTATENNPTRTSQP